MFRKKKKVTWTEKPTEEREALRDKCERLRAENEQLKRKLEKSRRQNVELSRLVVKYSNAVDLRTAAYASTAPKLH